MLTPIFRIRVNKMAMRIESKLCYISENKAIVQVNGWVNEKNVGSALAEAETVELAEEKAILRLSKRLDKMQGNEKSIKVKKDFIKNNPIKIETAKSLGEIDKENINKEPNDWSNELTAIDSEVNRLNWTREDEIMFLEKNLNINNRNKITKFKDLISYLTMLRKINQDNTSSSHTLDIVGLIKESEVILKELSWDHIKGREFLQKEFNVSTRKELDEKQLISFIEKLKSMRNHNWL